MVKIISSNLEDNMSISKERPIINHDNGRYGFEEFLEKHLPDIEKEQDKLNEERGYGDGNESESRIELYDFLAWDVRGRMHRFRNKFELLGFVWLCAPHGQDVDRMRAAEQLWEMYECHSG